MPEDRSYLYRSASPNPYEFAEGELRREDNERMEAIVAGARARLANREKAESESTGLLSEGADESEPTDGTSVGEAAYAVAKDMSWGLAFEAVPQAWGGFMDALEEISQLPDDLVEAATGTRTPQLHVDFGDGWKVRMLSGDQAAEARKTGQFTDDSGNKVDHAGGLFQEISTNEGSTVTGMMIRSAAQFLTSFLPVMGQTAKVIRPATRLGKWGHATSGAAVADFMSFDPYEDGIARLLNGIPALADYVPDYLAERNPEIMSALEGRMKNLLEGLVLAGMVDPMMRALRWYRERNLARDYWRSMDPEGGEKQAAWEKDIDDISSEEMKDYGGVSLSVKNSPDENMGPEDGDAAMFAADMSDEQRERWGGRWDTPEGEIFWNPRHIDGSEDIQAMMQKVLDHDAEAINIRRGGEKQTYEDWVARAETEKDVMLWHLGHIPNAEGVLDSWIANDPARVVAARKLLQGSARTVYRLGDIAAAPAATADDIIAFRRALSVHELLQREIIPNRTASARATAAWGVNIGDGADMALQLEELIRHNGGIDNSRLLANAIANGAHIGKAATKTNEPTWMGAFMEFFYANLLSSPSTHVVNFLGSLTTNMFFGVGERWLAPRIAKGVGLHTDIPDDEWQAYMFGMLQSNKAALQIATGIGKRDVLDNLAKDLNRSWKLDKDKSINHLGPKLGKVATDSMNLISAPARMAGVPVKRVEQDNFLARGINLAAALHTWPEPIMRGTDLFNKTMGYFGNVSALAWRRVNNDPSLQDPAARNKALSDIIANPPDDIHAEAVRQAEINTFVNPLGQTGRDLSGALSRYPVGRVFVPFQRSPTNIFKYSFSRTPLAFISQNIRKDLSGHNGNEKRAMTMAKIAMGTALMQMGAYWSTQGNITGSGSRDSRTAAMERRVRPPNSVQLPNGVWMRIDKTDPAAIPFLWGAEWHETAAGLKADSDREYLFFAMLEALWAIGDSKTYLQGPLDFFAAANPNDHTMDWERLTVNMIRPIAMPQAGLAGWLTRKTDEKIRQRHYRDDGVETDEVISFVNRLAYEFKRANPWMSDTLKPNVDVWGRDMTRFRPDGDGGFMDLLMAPLHVLNPFMLQRGSDDPIDRMIVSNGIKVSPVAQHIEGVPLNNHEHYYYSIIQGQKFRELMETQVANPSFWRLADGSDPSVPASKAERVEEMQQKARRFAQRLTKRYARQILADEGYPPDYPDLQQRIFQQRIETILNREEGTP